MRSFRDIPMLRASTLAVLVTAAVITGCNMDTTNPNAPDTKRAFATPEGLTQLLAGAIQNWVGTRDNYFVLPLTAQADNYTASWNNAAIRFYRDRKSTRLNSSHLVISYAVFCLKKKKKKSLTSELRSS